MSKYEGKGVTIIDKDAITFGLSSGVIEGWDNLLKKYKVDFGNGFCGWYTLKQMRID